MKAMTTEAVHCSLSLAPMGWTVSCINTVGKPKATSPDSHVSTLPRSLYLMWISELLLIRADIGGSVGIAGYNSPNVCTPSRFLFACSPNNPVRPMLCCHSWLKDHPRSRHRSRRQRSQYCQSGAEWLDRWTSGRAWNCWCFGASCGYPCMFCLGYNVDPSSGWV